MLHIDKTFINLLSSRLDNFKWKSETLANCRCPICGDSKKKLSKARGYFYPRGVSYYYSCHNCGVNLSLRNIIKELDVSLHDEYLMETFAEKKTKKPKKPPMVFTAPVFDVEPEPVGLIDQLLTRLDKLPADHEAVRYVVGRKLPKKSFQKMYYIDDVSDLENLSGKYRKKILGKEPRIVIPFWNTAGKMFAVTARAIRNEGLRYLTIRIDEDEPLIYGMDKIDFRYPLYVTEGIFDSFFVPNCIAVSGSDFLKIEGMFIKEKCTIIPDFQPRNPQIVKNINRLMERGFNVCLFPCYMIGKDINEFVLNGFSVEEIKQLIDNHTYSGLRLRAELSIWKKT